jgi:hypothetical protein
MIRLDHVQLAIPAGSEDLCRQYYVGVLGMEELEKPLELRSRGCLWLRSGDVQIHMGVEADFRPARKAHPAIAVTDIDAMATTLSGAGYAPEWDSAIPEIRRFYVNDPLGNRLEFLAGSAASPSTRPVLP